MIEKNLFYNIIAYNLSAVLLTVKNKMYQKSLQRNDSPESKDTNETWDLSQDLWIQHLPTTWVE